MKTTLEEISPVRKKLRVEIDAEEVNKKTEPGIWRHQEQG